jgi:cell fate (sporulation/competence/biofilm development) regulator YmcA (YheA/YmcA/DUF963 family)
MRLDLDKLTEMLNTSTDQIKNLSNNVQKSPQQAMISFQSFIPTIMEGYQQLQKASFDDVRTSAKDPRQLSNIQNAIQSFLISTKEAQEKAGVMQATLFSNPAFKEFTHKLQDLSDFLKRGVRVEKTEHEGL